MHKNSNSLPYIHIGLFTNNPKGLEKFYKSALGFVKEKENIIPKEIMYKIFGIRSKCNMIVLALSDIRLEIFYSRSLKFKKKIQSIIGLNHWGYFVKDKHKFVDILMQSGIKVNRIKRDNNRFTYFVNDPDGNRIEIMEPPAKYRN
jgi:catechol 2,3-dioxygenase-like lactoylglutathione lyase family enzyme